MKLNPDDILVPSNYSGDDEYNNIALIGISIENKWLINNYFKSIYYSKP